MIQVAHGDFLVRQHHLPDGARAQRAVDLADDPLVLEQRERAERETAVAEGSMTVWVMPMISW